MKKMFAFINNNRHLLYQCILLLAALLTVFIWEEYWLGLAVIMCAQADQARERAEDNYNDLSSQIKVLRKRIDELECDAKRNDIRIDMLWTQEKIK